MNSSRPLISFYRKCFSAVSKNPYTQKANASSYVKKPSSTSYASKYKKNTSTSSSAPSLAAKATSTTTETTPGDEIFNNDPFSEPKDTSTSSGSLAKSPFDNPKLLNTIFPQNLQDKPEQSASPFGSEINWSSSYYGIGTAPFPPEAQEVLAAPLDPKDIEIKPDGIIYLPEIKYRRILNKAFGAGGWGLVPRSETIVTDSLVTREYALVCLGRLVSIVRGEQDFFSKSGIATATEGCKSNALMRGCKDLGIASELWDPVFIKGFKSTYCEDKFVEHVTTKRMKKLWKRKDRTYDYPYKLATK
ncbi:Mitochondrial genome maintenance protein [Wickerhamomyces ciferrii]|uniref:Mitochondrial genome maintenance protein MGM101 n=1 Tax=Wickerhamomyces ciferrii (strain ATCC 14091 / BCRC 22168 / CBS 111 / JCM 3599 / NBRC 0793 / NRRL Y-1031 F-60-10) TaxID=1206466 RepID=K0KN48_WICCF|nr:Mitochondrial genome maintenance protein [Wickerhamomyces ciferrii]CCH42558.1 Mitochondrial genome maintenance protein [Wickerhamomyces ciferrii]